MSIALGTLLTLLLNYGYPIVFGVVFIGYLGVPMPSETILLAAGSLSADGSLNFWILLTIVTLTAIIGDTIMYFVGKRFGYLVVNRLTNKMGLTHHRLEQADSFLQKWGIWCIFITRWLITPLGIPINIMAGLSKYNFKLFLISVALGELLWSSIFISLGYIFGANWQILLNYINDIPQLLTIIVIGIFLITLSLRVWKRK